MFAKVKLDVRFNKREKKWKLKKDIREQIICVFQHVCYDTYVIHMLMYNTCSMLYYICNICVGLQEIMQDYK